MRLSQKIFIECLYLLFFVICHTAECACSCNHGTFFTFTIQLSFIANEINMTAPLTTGTKEQRAVIRLLWPEGVRGVEIY
jgi:hypothetical protein